MTNRRLAFVAVLMPLVTAAQSTTTGLPALKEDLAKEVDRATTVEKALQVQVDTKAPQNGLAAEIATRAEADDLLKANLDAETGARVSGDATIQGKLDSESQTRATQAASLQATIDAEAARATAAEAKLAGDLASETARAEGALTSGLAAESAARTAEDANTLAAAKAYADSLQPPSGNPILVRGSMDWAGGALAGANWVSYHQEANTFSFRYDILLATMTDPNVLPTCVTSHEKDYYNGGELPWVIIPQTNSEKHATDNGNVGHNIQVWYDAETFNSWILTVWSWYLNGAADQVGNYRPARLKVFHFICAQ